MADLICDGPGPHVPPSGILGTASRAIGGARCSSTACAPTPDQASQNLDAIRQRAQAALTANATFLALASPTNAQTLAQVQRLTRQCSALIRLTLNQLDTITDTA